MAILARPEAPDIETSSEDYARRFAGAVGNYFLRVQEELCLELLHPWRGCRVLDVGGGHAQIALPLAAAGYDVTVIGSDPSCSERLSRLAVGGPGSSGAARKIRFLSGDLLNLPFPDQRYDAVVSLRLISHIPAWRRLIAELTRVSRHAVLIDYPSLVSFNLAVPLLFKVKKIIEQNTRPFLCFTKREISEAFLQNDFIVSASRPQFFVPMALHRALGSLPFTELSETLFRILGATRSLGSPVLALAVPRHRN